MMFHRFAGLRHAHFVGIGGAGMCGIAEVLAQYDVRVSGCARGDYPPRHRHPRHHVEPARPLVGADRREPRRQRLGELDEAGAAVERAVERHVAEGGQRQPRVAAGGRPCGGVLDEGAADAAALHARVHVDLVEVRGVGVRRQVHEADHDAAEVRDDDPAVPAILVTKDVVVSMRRITREACARIAKAAFELAMERKRHVSAVHKANVLKIGDGMFLDECRKQAALFPEVTLDEFIVDAMMAHVIRAPARFDVIVTTNMFGDILTDLTAELSGSIGLGSSLNAGADYAMAQAAHGSAPDIAGKNLANPFSLILSASQLLAWHGRRKGDPAFAKAAAGIDAAVAAAIAAHENTRDIGGSLGTRETGEALAARLDA